MVKTRQQMLSRHGSSRGGSSCPSAEEEIHSHYHCPHYRCHSHCPHLGGASSLRHSQCMEASSPGSSSVSFFSSALFTFNSPLNCPRINAHVSILFIDEAQDEGGTSAPPEFVASVDMDKTSELPTADKGKGMDLPDLQMEKNEKQVEAVEAKKGQAQEVEEYGWCPIVEEVRED